jgi:hypothetical protein
MGIWERLKAGVKITLGLVQTGIGAGLASEHPWRGSAIMVSGLTTTSFGFADLIQDIAGSKSDALDKGLLVSTLETVGFEEETAKSIGLTSEMVQLFIALKGLDQTGKLIDYLNVFDSGTDAAKTGVDLLIKAREDDIKKQQEEQRRREEEERKNQNNE